MEKILTRIIFAAMSLSITFSTTSCSGDNEGGKEDIFDSANLIGEWYLSIATGFIIADDGAVDKFAGTFTEDDALSFMTFYENGDLFISTGENEADLKWELNRDKLTLTDPANGSSDTLTIIELSPTTLHYQIIILEEYINNYTFTKIGR